VEVVDADRATVIAEMGTGILDRQLVTEWSASGGTHWSIGGEFAAYGGSVGMLAIGEQEWVTAGAD
jgi:hypothetical protein